MKKAMLIISMALGLISSYSFAAKSDDLRDPFPPKSPISFNIQLEQIKNSQTVRVTFVKPADKSLTVVLKDPDGFEIFNFHVNVKTSILYQNFDFSDADLGIYKLEISDRKTKVVKQIKIQGVRREDFRELILY